MSKSIVYLVSLSCLVTLLWSCKADKPSDAGSPSQIKETAVDSSEEAKWKGTEKYDLTNNTSTIRLPTSWERATLAVIANREMTPAYTKANEFFEIAMRQLKPEDEVVDVWEANTDSYHALVMINKDTTTLTRGRVTSLSRGLRSNYDHMDEITEDTKITIAASSFKEDDTHQVAKFKYSFEKEETLAYLCTYFVTTPSRSFIVYEIAEDESDIELYLYSLK